MERSDLALRLESVMVLSFRDQLVITLIDKALIGGLLALAAYFFTRSLERFKGTQSLELEAFRGTQSLEMARFTQEQNRKIEEFKSRLIMDSESHRNVRLAVAEVSKRLAAATHSICWATWPAKDHPKSFESLVDKYDGEIHLLFSDLVAARVVLAALSPAVHDQMSPLIDQLYGLDVNMGEAKCLFEEDHQRALVALAKLHTAARKLDDALLEAVTNLTFDLPPVNTRPDGDASAPA